MHMVQRKRVESYPYMKHIHDMTNFHLILNWDRCDIEQFLHNPFTWKYYYTNLKNLCHESSTLLIEYQYFLHVYMIIFNVIFLLSYIK